MTGEMPGWKSLLWIAGLGVLGLVALVLLAAVTLGTREVNRQWYGVSGQDKKIEAQQQELKLLRERLRRLEERPSPP